MFKPLYNVKSKTQASEKSQVTNQKNNKNSASITNGNNFSKPQPPPEGKLITINTNNSTGEINGNSQQPGKTIKLRLSVIRAPHPTVPAPKSLNASNNLLTNDLNSSTQPNITNPSELNNKPNTAQTSILKLENNKNFLKQNKNIFTTTTPFITYNANDLFGNQGNATEKAVNSTSNLKSLYVHKNASNINNTDKDNKNKSQTTKKFSSLNINNINNNFNNESIKNINININNISNSICSGIQAECDKKQNNGLPNNKINNNIFNTTSSKILISTNNKVIGTNIISNNPNCSNTNNINININNSFSSNANNIININNYCSAGASSNPSSNTNINSSSNINNNFTNFNQNSENLNNLTENTVSDAPDQNIISLTKFNTALFNSLAAIDFKDPEKKKIKKRLKELRIKQKKLNREGSYNCGRWQPEEHERFIEAIMKFGNEWKQVQKYVGTRSSTQARSHAQKFFVKIKRSNILDFNIDLSKNSIKNLHEMANNLNSDEYVNAIKALNCVAFERKGNNSTGNNNNSTTNVSKRKHKKDEQHSFDPHLNISEDCEAKMNLM